MAGAQHHLSQYVAGRGLHNVLGELTAISAVSLPLARGLIQALVFYYLMVAPPAVSHLQAYAGAGVADGAP